MQLVDSPHASMLWQLDRRPERAKTVSAFFARVWARVAERAGMGREEFLRRVALTPADLDDPTGRLGRVQYLRILELQDQLEVDRPEPPPRPEAERLRAYHREFPLLVSAWLNAPTAGAGVASYLTYRPVLGESDWIVAREADGAVQLEYIAEGPQRFAATQALGNFQTIAGILRSYGVPARLRVGLQAPSPRRLALWEDAIELRLGQPANTLVLPRASLEAPCRGFNPALARIAARRLDTELEDLRRSRSLALRIEQRLRRVVAAQGCGQAAGEALLERVRAELELSRPALRRRLAAEGTTFQALLAGVRLREAQRLLEESRLSVAEIGERLGFRRQSAFTHFFRRLSGSAPLRWRQDVRRAG